MKKLEVTRSEMMVLREQGYSNRDIANILEISYPTVYKYLGKQGGRMDSVTRHMEHNHQPPAPAETPKPDAPQVQIISQTVAIDGYAFALNMSSKTISIGISDDNQFLLLRQDEVEKFTAAVMAAYRLFDGR